VKRFLKLAPVLLLPAIASASTLWKGDFETGDLSQWTRAQSVASDRLQVVSDVTREGSKALKVTVRQGDNPIAASGNRNEVVYLTEEAQGSEYYYKWSTLFPDNYPIANTWQLFAQWHQEGCCGSPPLEFYVVGQELHLRAGGSEGKIIWTGPLVRGQWNDFVLHVKWSSDPNVGFVELYRNGKLVAPKTYAATQFGGERNYLKLGLYRDNSISQVGVVYHDGFAMGTTLEDVMPPPPEPEAAPEPAPAPALNVSTPPTQQTPAPTPSVNPPAPSQQPSTSSLPGDPNGSAGDLQAGQGCGASATGGMPVMAAAVALALGVLMRRKPALAKARAPKR
jgi:uncharacterized protein (TIGR03382 family)